MSSQEQIDADTQVIEAAVTDLGTAASSIQEELTNLQAQVNQGQPVNLTGLQEAVAKLDPAIAGVDALKPKPAEKPAETPAPPAETPAETPAPVEPPAEGPPAP